jgi:hypothetical protein
MTKDLAKKNETKSELDKVFVEPGARVLDPTLIDKSLLDRMPNPSGWRLLVLPYKGKGVTDGGIQLIKERSFVYCYMLCAKGWTFGLSR